ATATASAPPDDVFYRMIQLHLCDIGRAFANVRLTPDGVFLARCPADGRHDFVIRLSDVGGFTAFCVRCCQTAASQARFRAAIKARLPYEVSTLAAPSALASAWVRQSAGAPAIAIRHLANGAIELLAVP